MTTGLQLGHPGIYPLGSREARQEPGFEPVRLDETGFVGVALRGPVDTPVLVASWSDYVRNFGAFEREAQTPDRLLPYAVQAFFAQGGERAWVLRVAPAPDWTGDDAEAATASFSIGLGTPNSSGSLPESPGLAAASEGTWGTGLRIRLGFEVLQSFDATLDDDGGIRLPAGAVLAPWSLLRLRPLDPPGLPSLGWVAGERRTDPHAGGRSAVLAAPLTAPAGGSLRVDVVTAVLEAAATGAGQSERLTGLGLGPDHRRFLPEVLASDSLLLRATGNWGWNDALPNLQLDDIPVLPVHPGEDRSSGIDFRSFYDDGPADQDSLDEAVHRGVDAMGRESRIGLLCAPDLYWRAAPPAPEVPVPVPVQHAASCSCGREDPCGGRDTAQQDPDYAPTDDVQPGLDARDPGDLAEIIRRQLRLVQVAELRHRFVALLDEPAGLSLRQIHDWRTGFDSSYAAAYFPWLGVPRVGPGRPALVQVPPSSFAAGIIAARERQLGLSWGPANALAAGAVLSADVVTDATHDALHLQGINVYRQERDGIRLSAARTLSTDPEYVQLSVRRLMTMLVLTLERQAQWLVFEPNTPQLRATLTRMLTAFLQDQHRRGAFAGGTEAESFFVQCDDGLNPPQSQGLGRLVAEIGVAPAFPLEYLLLRISQDVDGAVLVAGPEQEGGHA
ncbi:phage tail sheath family protein [Paeniglutamicibacter antarcticus]|uniref:Phage tail sheath family protein n=1 Tax=Arthrobacter terrae TaxID=2935737 RepID=A0A931G646_9MICC|nr:phage tail sheath C-terminal domain-containing protein [Arthrobacter terrae]MBG0737924.1 phage tail sheath family protein [Arthrobacter terrae]